MPMEIRYDIDWPFGNESFHRFPEWDEVRKAVDTLEVNGTAVELVFDNDKDPERARRAAQKYAKATLHCFEKSWALTTRIRQRTLYMRKVSFQAQSPLPRFRPNNR